jgi:hypothetical protein
MHVICHLQVFEEQRMLDQILADDAADSARAVVDEATIEVTTLVQWGPTAIFLHTFLLPILLLQWPSDSLAADTEVIGLSNVCKPAGHRGINRPIRQHIVPNQVVAFHGVMKALTAEDWEELQELNEQLEGWQEAGFMPSEEQVDGPLCATHD